MEPKLNLNGTKIELNWNLNGTKTKQNLNCNGIQMELKWNTNGIENQNRSSILVPFYPSNLNLQGYILNWLSEFIVVSSSSSSSSIFR